MQEIQRFPTGVNLAVYFDLRSEEGAVMVDKTELPRGVEFVVKASHTTRPYNPTEPLRDPPTYDPRASFASLLEEWGRNGFDYRLALVERRVTFYRLTD